jgi:hypothetical protein
MFGLSRASDAPSTTYGSIDFVIIRCKFSTCGGSRGYSRVYNIVRSVF